MRAQRYRAPPMALLHAFALAARLDARDRHYTRRHTPSSHHLAFGRHFTEMPALYAIFDYHYQTLIYFFSSRATI